MKGVTTVHRCKMATPFFLALALALGIAPMADAQCLDWPMGDVYNGQVSPGYRIRVSQNYANRGGPDWFDNRPHAGVDLVYTNLNNVDAPVYAAGDGTVRYAGNVNYPGWVVVIEHPMPGGSIYTQYGHVGDVSVSNGDWVSKGTQIGTLWDQGDNTHLHFEVRDFLFDPINGTEWGPGYGSVNLEPWEQGWLDPVAFIYDHRAPFPHTAFLTDNRNIRAAPTITGTYLDWMPAGPVIAEDVVEDSVDAGRWWYKVRYNNGANTGYINGFWKGDWGSDVYFGEVPRLCKQIIPGILNNSYWDTNIYIRNTRLASNTVRVTVYYGSGTQAYTESRTLNNNGSWRFSFSHSVSGGTAVVTADYGQHIVAAARIQKKNGGDDAYASFEGIDLPLTVNNVPVVHHNNSGWYNQIFLYNPDSHRTVVASVDYSSSSCSESRTLSPGETEIVNTYYNSCLPSGWYGGARISATVSGTGDPAVVAVMSLQERRSGSIRLSMAAAAISWDTGKRLYAPLVQNNNSGYIAGLGAEKASGSGGLSVTYHEDNGVSCLTDPTFTNWPVIEPLIPVTSSSCESVLSAILTGTSSADFIYAQLNQVSGSNVTSYPVPPHPARQIHVPFLEGGAVRGIQVQNTMSYSDTVYIRFYADNGSWLATLNHNVPGRGFWTVLTGIPAGARNAEVWANNAHLAVMVNNVMTGGGRDKLMDYIAPGRP